VESNKETWMVQLRFGLNKMKSHYVQCKERWSIMTEARFEVDFFKDDFPDIYDQFQIEIGSPSQCPWTPYFPELGEWEEPQPERLLTYISYIKRLTNLEEVPQVAVFSVFRTYTQ
ncbi:hypothetical protein HAX54_017260, partial [Datura stramonium]|nr:hypothetical protein [Datura stramonium]